MNFSHRLIALAAAAVMLWLPIQARGAEPASAAATPRTGVWTYAGTGTVNTYWIETPGGSLVVIDTQRDLKHAALAVQAVRAVGKPVKAILITHAHPDHYTGIGLFKQAFPEATVYGSAATVNAIRTDAYGYNAVTRKDAPDVTPDHFITPDVTIEDNSTLQIDGLSIVTRELGAGEAHATTAYYLPASGDLYPGDVILNHLHAPLLEGATSSWLAILDRLEVLYPDVRTVHPGHGIAGPKQPMFDDQRAYLRACRAIAAEEIAHGGFTDAAKAAAVKRINAQYAYVNPTGIADIVKTSVDGLFQEFSAAADRPVAKP
ncbi:putative hydrolase [Janthinobacterium sp. HH01]|uniref:MBL fold metallo-hydrolase n=1 Tax=Janthinobacterium sp. HH01 TaxID=1198452 RepID=UPI0002AEB144|nr:MBL fold metallo-hydrolase [Janthinobacterium sp. HH01]ELX09059.1 putative hydrolase [Janthinobacterium sp. HH01]